MDRGDGLRIEAGARHHKKSPASDAAGPDRAYRRFHDQARELLGTPGQADLARQHIDGAERQHADRSRATYQTIHHRIQRAVTPSRDDRVEIGFRLARQPLGVAKTRPGAAQHDPAALPLERGNEPPQAALRGSRPARRRVDDDQDAAPHHPALCARRAWPAMLEPAARRVRRQKADPVRMAR